MHRIYIFSIAAAFLLSSCSSSSMPATELPSPLPITQIPLAQTVPQAGPFGALEVISPQNWERLQLLQTLPAEMLPNYFRVMILPDEKTMLLGSNEAAHLFFVDLESGKTIRSLDVTGVKNSDARFSELKYLSDGSIMASSSGPYMTYRIDGSTGDVLTAWEGSDFAISADEQTMAISANLGTSLINLTNNTPITFLENTDSVGYSLSPDNSKLAVYVVNISEDTGNIDIWDIEGKTIIKTLPDLYLPSYSPNGKFLIAKSNIDDPLKIFSPDGADQITTITDSYSSYLISPDGSLVVYQNASGISVARDTISWDASETTLNGALNSFSPAGHMLVTHTEDGGILIWGVLAGGE
jgi:hypothetical protein